MRRSGTARETVQKHPVTPGALLPAYEASLKTWPGRYNTLLGAARAAAAMPDAVKAKAYYEELLANVGDAETPRPGVEEARAYR